MFPDGASNTTKMGPTDDGGHIPAIHRDLVEVFATEAKTLQLHRSIDHAIDLKSSYNLPYRQITNKQSAVERSLLLS
jgi:hypothetical protein